MLNIILGMSCQFLKLNSAVNKLSAISHIILGALTLILSVRSEDEDQCSSLEGRAGLVNWKTVNWKIKVKAHTCGVKPW